MPSFLYADKLFAPLDTDLHLERIAGGNETEVYCTDDRRFVVKVKSDAKTSPEEAFKEAQILRQAVHDCIRAIGTEYTIPNYFIVAQNSAGNVQPVAIQPYHRDAIPLFAIDYTLLNKKERRQLARHLLRIIRRSLTYYFQTRRMPDLYGRASQSPADRQRKNTWYMFPWRLWHFIVKRNLLRSNNLMLTTTPERRIILVDYDPIRKGKVYLSIYYTLRLFLFIRDFCLILWLVGGGNIPHA